MTKARETSSAFTLIELLAVMAIIVLAASFMGPAIGTILRGSHLTQASDMLVSNLALAKQSAISNNCQVEVRFYQYSDPESPGEQASDPTSGKYRALQLFQIGENGVASACGKVERLPQMIIIDSGTTLSTLLSSPKQDPTDAIPRAGKNYKWCAFRFRPDGSTNLSPIVPAYWCVTLHNATEGDNLAKPPANYATIQIDPISGSLKSYRP